MPSYIGSIYQCNIVSVYVDNTPIKLFFEVFEEEAHTIDKLMAWSSEYFACTL